MSERPSAVPSSRERKAVVDLIGISGSPGVAIGRVVLIGPLRHGVPRRQATDADFEMKRFKRAVQRAQRDLRGVAERAPALAAHSVLDAYVLMAQDPTLEQEVEGHIRDERRCAEWAVALSVEAIAEKLSR